MSCHVGGTSVLYGASSGKVSLSLTFAEEVRIVWLHHVVTGVLFDGM